MWWWLCQAWAVVPWEPHALDLGEAGFSSVAAGDLDGDGTVDLVLVERRGTSTVWWFRGLGNGAFDPVTELRGAPQLDRVQHVAIGDIDADGTDDIVILHEDDEHREFLTAFGLDEGTVRLPPRSVDHWSRKMILADLTGDGRNDLAVLWCDCGYWQWSPTWGVDLLEGAMESDAAFRALDPDPSLLEVYDVQVGDVNADGCADLVLAGWVTPDPEGPSPVYGFSALVQAKGELAPANLGEPLEGLDYFTGVVWTVADIDGDQASDVLSESSGALLARRQKAPLSFGTTQALGAAPASYGLWFPVVGDVDGDGADEVFLRNRRRGDDGFLWASAEPELGLQPAPFDATLFHDLDGDGDLDAVAYDEEAMTWWENGAPPPTTRPTRPATPCVAPEVPPETEPEVPPETEPNDDVPLSPAGCACQSAPRGIGLLVVLVAIGGYCWPRRSARP